nr:hypothetical protein [Tanacetum cinerariifolium]
MSRDVITVGSTMRILLLYRGEYSQWRKRFMNYLEEQKDGEAMINSIQNEKKTQKIDRLARSLLIQWLPNDIYSLIDSNKTAKDLWDAFERQMRGSGYGEQDWKAKCGYKKDNCELNYKFLNNMQPAWKQYGTLMRQTKNLMDINIDALYNILKQNQGDVNDALGYKKKAVVITSDPLALVAEKMKVNKQKEKSANKQQKFFKSDDKKEDKKVDEKKKNMSKVKCYNCKKEGHFAKDCKKAKVKDYNYYKTKMLLAKKDSDEQVLLAEDQAWMESSSDSDQEINANMVFMAQIKKVLSESDESSSSAEETIAEVAYYTFESESEFEFKTLEYYDNSTNYGLFVNNDDEQEIFHDAIESASENFIENRIDSQKDYDKSEVDHNDSEEKEYLVDKLIRKFNQKIAKSNQQSKDLENQNKDLQEKYDVLINQVKTFEEKNNEFNEQIKVLNEKNADLLAQTEVLHDQLKVKYVVIDTHTESLEIKKFKRARENKIEFAYDYGNLNASYVNEKIKFSDEYFQEIINPDFEKIDSLFQQTSSLKPYVPNVILEKIIIDLEDEVVSLLEKEKANLKIIESLKSKGFESSENAISESESESENDVKWLKKSVTKWRIQNKLKRKSRKRKSSKQNFKQVNNDVSRDNSDFVHFLDLDTFSSVRRPKNSGVIWKKKGSYNTSNVDLSSVSVLKLNKNVKRYSRKDLLSCNNYHLGETSSAYVCNDAMNVSCNSRMCDLFNENNLFNFYDESVRISPVSKMPFRKKPRNFLNVRSKCISNQSLSRTVHMWLPKMQPLAEPVAKWIPRVKRQIDKISKTPNSPGPIFKWHMTGNRALLSNFMEKFFGTVRFGNNDFAVIAGYGDVVIGSMTIKKVYYVEGLGHNLFSIAQFRDKGLEVAFRKSTCFVRNEDGVDLLTVQHVRTDNGTEFKNKTIAKFFDEVGITQQFSAARTPQQNGVVERRNRTLVEAARTMLTFANLPLFFWAEAITIACFTKIIHESVNVNFDEILEMDSKQFSLEPGLPNLNELGKSSNPSVSQVSKTSKKDLKDLFQNLYDEYFDSSKIMKSTTTNVETSINEEVFHEVSESFQGESSSSSLNDNVQQSPKEVILPQTNTQSISNNMIPNVDEASTSHNVFNEHLEDAYFDATEALKDADWVTAMQEELDQFARLKSKPNGSSRIKKMKAVWLFET